MASNQTIQRLNSRVYVLHLIANRKKAVIVDCAPSVALPFFKTTKFAFAVGVVALAHVRVAGPYVGVATIMFNFSRLIDGAPGARPIENLIWSIPAAVLFDNP